MKCVCWRGGGCSRPRVVGDILAFLLLRSWYFFTYDDVPRVLRLFGVSSTKYNQPICEQEEKENRVGVGRREQRRRQRGKKGGRREEGSEVIV